MKPGDVMMIYMDPKTCTVEAGQATLIEEIKSTPFPSDMEYWLVAYKNRPCVQEKVLIKIPDAKNET
jgi:hypothetical protein